jgi:hypothetical protein
MTSGTYQIDWTVGALDRGHVRRVLNTLDTISWNETKGFLDSQFVIRTYSRVTYETLMHWMTEMAQASKAK